MTIYFEKLPEICNIQITWLLMFLASLEYNLNPCLFTDESKHKADKQLSYKNYKDSSYNEAQHKLEMLLGKYFEEVLKKLFYKPLVNNNFYFDYKDPLLTMMF